MKKIILIVALVCIGAVLTACTQAQNVSYNVSKEADAFNVTRRLTVINSRTDKPMFELIGQFSVQGGRGDYGYSELSVICQTGPNEYKKHLVGLNEWTMYVVEDIGGADVTPYRYEINFLPESIIPVEFTSSY